MDRLDMALDDIIMQDKGDRRRGARRQQNGRTPAANQGHNQNKNHNQRQQRPYPAAAAAAGGKARITTAGLRARAQPYARPNSGSFERPAQIWTRKAVAAGNVRILGGPRTGLVTTHSLQGGGAPARNPASAGIRSRQQVAVQPQPQPARQARVVSAAPPTAVPQQSISIRGAARPVTVVLSHLDPSTSADDIKLVAKSVGPIQDVSLLYDSNGNPTGTAEIVYADREVAMAAVKQFDNIVADGHLVRCYVKPGPGDPVPTAPAWTGQQTFAQGVQRQAVVQRPAKILYKPTNRQASAASGAMYSDRIQQGGAGYRTAPTFTVTY